jgi:two-component system sensor histidine kinase PilS (NtrC family)
VSPLRDDRDQVIGRVVNFQDLTELRRLEAIARRNERLATVGQLAAGIAHEIRNPLASISGSIELLSRSAPASDDDRALMAIVLREIERLNALITELLEYANPRPRRWSTSTPRSSLDDVRGAAAGSDLGPGGDRGRRRGRPAAAGRRRRQAAPGAVEPGPQRL